MSAQGLGLWGMEGQTVDDEIRFVCKRIGNIRSLVIVEPEDTLLSGLVDIRLSSSRS